MTNDQLNQLFESAKTIPTITSSDEIASWLGVAAASSTGVLGTIGKLKLFIAKKSLVMLASTLTIITAGVITTVALLPSDASEMKLLEKKTIHTPKVMDAVSTSSPDEIILETENLAGSVESEKERSLETSERLKTVPVISWSGGESPEASLQEVIHATDARTKKESNDSEIEKEYAVSGFSKIEASGVYDLVLIQGEKAGVKIKATAEVHEIMKVSNQGQLLKLDMDGKIKKASKTIVYVTFVDLKDLSFSGVGDLSTQGTIKLNQLNCEIASVGDISLEISCTDLNVDFSGVGDVSISGSGDQAKYYWAGVGDLKAKNLMSKDVNLTLSGVGDASVNASEKIEIKLTGLGDVKYTGSPKNKSISKSGIGKVSGS